MILLCDGTNIFRTIFEASLRNNKTADVELITQHCVSSVMRAVKEDSPTHVAIVNDYGGLTWRHALYPDYKGHRPTPHPSFKIVSEKASLALTEEGFFVISVKNMEADDVIGTFARKLSQLNIPSLIRSTDKDYFQAITGNTSVKHHFNGQLRDLDYMQSRYGFSPALFIDYLALVGDSADNIPGVPSIGDKTAIKLIKTHGGIDSIIENMAYIKGVVGKNIRKNTQTIKLAYQLAKIKTDIDLGINLKNLSYEGSRP